MRPSVFTQENVLISEDKLLSIVIADFQPHFLLCLLYDIRGWH